MRLPLLDHCLDVLALSRLNRPRPPRPRHLSIHRGANGTGSIEQTGLPPGDGLAVHAGNVRWRPSLSAGLAILTVGIASIMVALTIIDRSVTTFPSVSDVIQARLPYFGFGVFGEVAFATFLLVAVTTLFRHQQRSLPALLVMMGVFYALRGVFLFLLPIGSPPTGPAFGERFVLYPYSDHAYFPAGHTGLMTILSLSLQNRRLRRVMLIGTAVFALGTIVARAHYTADALGGYLLGYGLTLWGRHHLDGLASDTHDSALPRGEDALWIAQDLPQRTSSISKSVSNSGRRAEERAS